MTPGLCRLMPSCDGAAEETHLGAEARCPLRPWHHRGQTQGTGWTGKDKELLTTYPNLYLFVPKIIFLGWDVFGREAKRQDCLPRL